MHPFTQSKFCSLSTLQQQRHCVRVLDNWYNSYPSLEAETEYAEICSWIGIAPLIAPTAYEVADRYHEHLRETGLEVKEHLLLPKINEGDSTTPSTPPLAISIYLDRLRSAHNVGSILRTTEALQLGSVVLGGHTPGPDNRKVENAAMGTADWVPCRQGTITDCPRPIIAVETVEDAPPLWDFSFPRECTIVLGNEEQGISPELLSQADACVTLPLVGRKNSLNVANAFAVVAWEIHRQHRSSNQEPLND